MADFDYKNTKYKVGKFMDISGLSHAMTSLLTFLAGVPMPFWPELLEQSLNGDERNVNDPYLIMRAARRTGWIGYIVDIEEEKITLPCAACLPACPVCVGQITSFRSGALANFSPFQELGEISSQPLALHGALAAQVGHGGPLLDPDVREHEASGSDAGEDGDRGLPQQWCA